uniref:Uncharacterized protein n=1 Tax=Rhizophora mucronata TaxID=61149 RepID=A0A2P2PG81_RHIMU
MHSHNPKRGLHPQRININKKAFPVTNG